MRNFVARNQLNSHMLFHVLAHYFADYFRLNNLIKVRFDANNNEIE